MITLTLTALKHDNSLPSSFQELHYTSSSNLNFDEKLKYVLTFLLAF